VNISVISTFSYDDVLVAGDDGAMATIALRRRGGFPVLKTVMELEEIDDGDTVWRFRRSFLLSNWTCIWGRGCHGILSKPAEHLGQGCCSVGAHLEGEDESRLIAALAATLPADRFEHHAEARLGGIFTDAASTATRVADGACIFFDRPDFAGGAGCSLHLAALEAVSRRWSGSRRRAGSCRSRSIGNPSTTTGRWPPCGGGRGVTGVRPVRPRHGACTEGTRAYGR
jgi:hypothetical protein